MRHGLSLQRTTEYVPGKFDPCVRDPSRVERVFPSTLQIGCYRRPRDNSPCFLFLRCWPDGRIEFFEDDDCQTAKGLLQQKKANET